MVHVNHFKRKGVIFYLQHPGSEPVIQQHVEAQDLEAGTAGDVVGETRVVVMFEDGVSGDQSLYNHVLDVVPHLVCVAADGLQQLVESGKLSEGQKNNKYAINAVLEFRINYMTKTRIARMFTVCCPCPHHGQSSHCSC